MRNRPQNEFFIRPDHVNTYEDVTLDRNDENFISGEMKLHVKAALVPKMFHHM